MKKLLVILGVVISSLTYGQRVFTDSLDMAAVTGTDTIIFPALGKITAGTGLSIEFVYTGLNAADAYIAVGFSNKGNTFNYASTLFGASADSVQLNTATAKIVPGYYTGITNVKTKQSSVIFTGSSDRLYGKYFAFRVHAGSVSTGKIYYYILKP